MRTIGVSLAAALVYLLAASPAQADLILTLDDLDTPGIDAIIVDDADGGVGTATPKGASTHADGVAGDGAVFFMGTVGAFTVQITTGTSKPVIGDATHSLLEMLNASITGGDGTLEIMLTDTDYSVNSPTGIGEFYHAISGGTTGTVDFETILDYGNNPFAMGAGVKTTLNSNGMNAYAHEVVAVGDSFSLTKSITIYHTGKSATLFYAGAGLIPEPASLSLLALGALVVLRRRRR